MPGIQLGGSTCGASCGCGVGWRSYAQVGAFFDGWDLVEPGLVQVPRWRPDGRPPRPRELDRVWVYGGVARKST